MTYEDVRQGKWYVVCWDDRAERLQWRRFILESDAPGVYIEFRRGGQVTPLGLSMTAASALLRALQAFDADPLPQYVIDWLDARKATTDAGEGGG